MKFVRKLVMLLLILSVLFGLFVIIYSTRPDVIEAALAVFHPEQKQVEVNAPSGNSENNANSGKYGEMQEEDESGTLDGLAENIYPEYIPPRQSDITVPEQVSGRTGYQQIQEERQQIEDEEARLLENQLTHGQTGDGLIFDAVYYPYYGMLDEKGRHLYRQIYANADALNQAFAPVEQISASQLRNVFSAVYNDHPELFWLETAYRCKYKRTGECVEIALLFNRKIGRAHV